MFDCKPLVRAARGPATWAACAAAVLLCAAMPAQAVSILKIQPISVCDDAGANCANAAHNLFLAESNKIWAQAGITLEYADFTSVKSSTYRLLDNQAEVTGLFTDAPGAAAGNTVSMWFVANHFNAWGEVQAIPGKYVVIDSGIFAGGRIDTIAHEIGHLLGLKHNDPGVEKDFLMRSGDDRTTPGAIGDITPDGLKLSKLTAAQITTAQGDGKLVAAPVPEPQTYALMLAGLGIIGWAARRTRCPVA